MSSKGEPESQNGTFVSTAARTEDVSVWNCKERSNGEELGNSKELENRKEHESRFERGNRKERFHKAVSFFSANSSLTGMGFVHATSKVKIRLFWIFLYTSVISALLYHVYSTVSQYLDYKTKTRLERSFMQSMNLPAVTICNHNPVRLSKKELLPRDLQDIIDDPSGFGMFMNGTSTFEYVNLTSETAYDEAQTTLINNFYSRLDSFLSKMSIRDRVNLQKAGHQYEDMILWCLMSRDLCQNTSVKLFHSYDYNNCYTLDTSMFIQNFSGALQGLEFALYLEPEEYLAGVTDIKGFHLIIHSNNSYFYPSEEGIPLGPGMMTFVEVSLENITRLGKPYSACVETDEYIHKYNFSYSVDLCYELCWRQQYISNCKCYLSSWFDVIYNPTNAKICDVNNNCESPFYPELCSCEKPCRQSVYHSRVESAQWPSRVLGNALVEYLCSKRDFPKERCEKLMNQSEIELRDNFVGIRIYFESMFVTYLNDEAEINLTAFLSNLGGCLGLWMGISVFHVFELLYLLTKIVWTTLPTTKAANYSL